MTGLVWDVNKLRIATDAAGIALWSWNVDTDQLELDERGYSLWGVPKQRNNYFRSAFCLYPSRGPGQVRAAFAATRDMLGAYETDFRILCDSKVRWISARGRGDDQGIVGRIMYGVFIHVTERKEGRRGPRNACWRNEPPSEEYFCDHFCTTTISARSTTTKDEMVHDLRQRIFALSNAHDMVRPDQPTKAAQLEDLLGTLLKPYASAHSKTERVHISTPRLLVGEKSATALALIVHKAELATNSIKYGALSNANGALDVQCSTADGEVEIIWSESGGPLTHKPSGRSGFGTKLVVSSLSDQLGGTISASWPPTGAVITLKMSEARLGA